MIRPKSSLLISLCVRGYQVTQSHNPLHLYSWAQLHPRPGGIRCPLVIGCCPTVLQYPMSSLRKSLCSRAWFKQVSGFTKQFSTAQVSTSEDKIIYRSLKLHPFGTWTLLSFVIPQKWRKYTANVDLLTSLAVIHTKPVIKMSSSIAETTKDSPQT